MVKILRLKHKSLPCPITQASVVDILETGVTATADADICNKADVDSTHLSVGQVAKIEQVLGKWIHIYFILIPYILVRQTRQHVKRMLEAGSSV